MTKYATILLLMVMICSACNKKGNESVWSVNGVAYSTDKATLAITKGGNFFNSESRENGFEFSNQGVGVESAPKTGTGLLSTDYTTHNPYDITAVFYVNSVYYILLPGHKDTLTVSKISDKYRYVMSPSWFVNYNNASDSVLIEGTFNET